jgi:hypothetical protein
MLLVTLCTVACVAGTKRLARWARRALSLAGGCAILRAASAAPAGLL